MNRVLLLALFVALLGGTGLFLLLPHRHGAQKPGRVHAAGLAVGALGLFLLAALWTPPGPWLEGLFFYGFGLASIAGGALMVTSRDPIHAALWFASVVLSTSGLFLLADAQFLAAGTVIVYAGAIIVTFLFVIMLAQMEGRSTYDRAARSPFMATFTCTAIFLGVLWCLVGPKAPAGLPRATELAETAGDAGRARVASITARALPPSIGLNHPNGAAKPHVAGLGESLYSDHIVTVELAGALLFVALIGALAIATPKAPIRPGDRAASSSTLPTPSAS
ncbi:MAG: NADH-quinone oxidoreductase subunit J [Thermoleophilia bacterium]|nr:NADH-quinone oxidoreductase subunit J [Thermoleophilia bacterium]